MQAVCRQFFELTNSPFSKGMESERLYMTEGHEEALGRLNYVADENKFAILTGECGTGKTTLLRKLRDSLDDKRFDFLYLSDSQLTPRHFYNGLLSQLGREGSFYRGDAKRKLHQEIELIHGVKRRDIVIVVDEAHLLDKEMLEELRFLLNFKMDSENPLTLILSGQTELEEILDKKSSEAIRQRIDLCCRLSPLSLSESYEYIKCHMAYAGAKDEIFLESAVKVIYGYSSGLARLINKACVSCLMYATIKKNHTIDDVMAKEVIETELK
jgi:type II secretory pathway predicted ATPase ExeA